MARGAAKASFLRTNVVLFIFTNKLCVINYFHSLRLGNFNCQEGKRACESAHGDIFMFKFRNVVPHPN